MWCVLSLLVVQVPTLLAPATRATFAKVGHPVSTKSGPLLYSKAAERLYSPNSDAPALPVWTGRQREVWWREASQGPDIPYIPGGSERGPKGSSRESLKALEPLDALDSLITKDKKTADSPVAEKLMERKSFQGQAHNQKVKVLNVSIPRFCVIPSTAQTIYLLFS